MSGHANAMKFEVIDESANFFVQVQWDDEVEVPFLLNQSGKSATHEDWVLSMESRIRKKHLNTPLAIMSSMRPIAGPRRKLSKENREMKEWKSRKSFFLLQHISHLPRLLR